MSRTPVYRTVILNGLKIPGIIHNGGYHFTHFDVYEDGRVANWNFEDFEHFIKDVHEGWVVTSIPDSEEISCFNLGAWKIGDGYWYYTPDTYIAYIRSLVLELNPDWINIHTFQKQVVNGVIVGESGASTLYKVDTMKPDKYFPKKVKGEFYTVFYVLEDKYYLVRLLLFKDGIIAIHGCGDELLLDLDELRELITIGQVCSTLAMSSRVVIENLGEFTVLEEGYSNDINDLLAEIEDDYRKLNGQKTSNEFCLEALEVYKANPSEGLKEILKEAYERVPEHLRMYLGDMDTRDSEIIEIIYGSEYREY